jgi:multidrug efflux pump subunit AcrA (membrane-fusion protein)
LGDSDLKAPLNGYILAGNVDVGTLASPSAAALTIADTSAVKATFGVPEDALNLVHFGQSLTFQVQNDTAQYSGRVTGISSSADARSRVFAIEVTLSNRRNTLKPGPRESRKQPERLRTLPPNEQPSHRLSSPLAKAPTPHAVGRRGSNTSLAAFDES